jgi:K+-sensing histidine kinase KdpD
MNESFLVAVDPSPASQKAVDYVARMLASHWQGMVQLVHVLTPDESEQPEGGEARTRARKLMESLRQRMVEGGVGKDRVDLGFLAHDPQYSMVEGLIDLARDHSCDTIVVGRNSLPWYREAFHHHPADELVRRGGGFTVWIVE